MRKNSALERGETVRTRANEVARKPVIGEATLVEEDSYPSIES